MKQMLTGAALALAGLGVCAGAYLLGRRSAQPARVGAEGGCGERPEQDEMRRMEEDQKAFRQVLSYSAETAYGLTGEEGAV